MARAQICRVEKNSNYTTMGNFHLRDKNLSLKAKGLLSVVLSLPPDWDYSIAGLVAIVLEKETVVRSCLKELKEVGYLVVEKECPTKENGGHFNYIYRFYEKSQLLDHKVENSICENLDLEVLDVEVLDVENQRQINTNILSKEKLSKEKEIVSKETKQKPKKLRVVDENGEVRGGHPYTERAYELWEEIMGQPCKRDQWNSRAGWNIMRAKNKGEEWLKGMLVLARECKKDSKADFRASHVANLADLQKNQEYVLDWYRKKKLEEDTSANRGLDFLRKKR